MDLTLREAIDNARKKWRSHPEYYPIVLEASELFEKGEEEEARDKLLILPTVAQLLDMLVERLKGKPVYKTLKKISRGDINSEYEEMKGWFSLGTHIAIELEKDHYEYSMLLPLLYERLGRLVDVCK